MLLLSGNTKILADSSLEPVSSAAPSELNSNDISTVVENASFNSKGSISGLIKGPVLTQSEQLEAIEKSDLSEERKKIAREKQMALTDDSSLLKVTAATSGWSYLPGTFNLYTQIYGNYCAPAAVKSAMHYLTGSSDSQGTIAAALGTSVVGTVPSNIKTYLNSHQSVNSYVSKSATVSIATMKNDLSTGITTYHAPPLLGIKTSTTEGWSYTVAGHSVLVNAYANDLNTFQLADPLIKYLNSSGNPYYSMSASAIYGAIQAFGDGYIY